MNGYKVTKKEECCIYEAAGHNECKLTRYHDGAEVEDGRLWFSRSHFLPHGGGTNFGANGIESIYYVEKGKLLFTGEDGKETILEEGDSVHIAANSAKSVTNVGTDTAVMLVFYLPPVK